jgi:hypothetical protein
VEQGTYHTVAIDIIKGVFAATKVWGQNMRHYRAVLIVCCRSLIFYSFARWQVTYDAHCMLHFHPKLIR